MTSLRVASLSVVLVGTACLGAAPRQDSQRTSSFDERMQKLPEEYPIGSHSALGSLTLRKDGAWVVEFQDAEGTLVFFPVQEEGNVPTEVTQFHGHIDVILDGTYLVVTVVTEDGAYYEGRLHISREGADGLAASLTSMQAAVAFTPIATGGAASTTASATRDGLERPFEVNCDGGSCSCTGKCDVCCPSGYYPYCNCSGAGTCRCIKSGDVH